MVAIESTDKVGIGNGMAESTVTLRNRDTIMPVVWLAVMAVSLSVVFAFSADQRGLLQWNSPGAAGAFAAGPASPVTDSFDVVYLGLRGPTLSGSRLGTDSERRISRVVPSRDGTRGVLGPEGPSPGPASGPAAFPTNEAQPGTVGEAISSQDAPNIVPQNGASPFVPGEFGGGGGGAPAVLVVPEDPDPTAPVVPAVPEPSVWLLMILGVGGLAGALRRKFSTQDGKSVVTVAS